MSTKILASKFPDVMETLGVYHTQF